MRRCLAALVAAFVLAAMTVLAGPPVAAAPNQQPDAPADDGTGGSADDEGENPQPVVPDQDIIPRPNSGHEPTEAGDRGGALQVLVFVAIVVGVGTVGLLAARDIRRSRAKPGPAPQG